MNVCTNSTCSPYRGCSNVLKSTSSNKYIPPAEAKTPLSAYVSRDLIGREEINGEEEQSYWFNSKALIALDFLV